MTDGMTEVERLAYAVLVRVFRHDALLHGDRLSHHALQFGEVGLREVEVDVLSPHAFVADERMLQHLGVARTEVLGVERVEKAGVYNDEACVGERSYLVLQSAEVDARLASHRRVDHSEQRRGYVYEVDAALECGGSESAEVGYHAAAEVYEQRVACSAALLQRCPHVAERSERLMLVAVSNGDGHGIVLRKQRRHFRQAALVRSVVGEHKDAVVLRLGDGCRQVVLYVV